MPERFCALALVVEARDAFAARIVGNAPDWARNSKNVTVFKERAGRLRWSPAALFVGHKNTVAAKGMSRTMLDAEANKL